MVTTVSVIPCGNKRTLLAISIIFSVPESYSKLTGTGSLKALHRQSSMNVPRMGKTERDTNFSRDIDFRKRQ